VERRLRKLGIEHRTERTPYRRSDRPEVEELTRQRRVPVLVDGEEVIHDSKRILQYLEWKHGPPEGRDADSAETGLYNVKPDGDPERSDHAHRQGGGEDQGADRR
jgi:glutathione S-transferase